MEGTKKAISSELAGGTEDWENGVWNDLSDGWQSKASQTVEAEFDGQPLGSLNAELYTILFSFLNTGTHCRWRGRDESTMCVCMCVPTSQMLKFGPSMDPGEVEKLLWVDNV